MSSDSDSSTSTVDGVALSQEMMDEDLIELCNKHEIRAEVFNFFHYENVNSLEDLAMYFEDKKEVGMALLQAARSKILELRVVIQDKKFVNSVWKICTIAKQQCGLLPSNDADKIGEAMASALELTTNKDKKYEIVQGQVNLMTSSWRILYKFDIQPQEYYNLNGLRDVCKMLKKHQWAVCQLKSFRLASDFNAPTKNVTYRDKDADGALYGGEEQSESTFNNNGVAYRHCTAFYNSCLMCLDNMGIKNTRRFDSTVDLSQKKGDEVPILEYADIHQNIGLLKEQQLIHSFESDGIIAAHQKFQSEFCLARGRPSSGVDTWQDFYQLMYQNANTWMIQVKAQVDRDRNFKKNKRLRDESTNRTTQQKTFVGGAKTGGYKGGWDANKKQRTQGAFTAVTNVTNSGGFTGGKRHMRLHPWACIMTSQKGQSCHDGCEYADAHHWCGAVLPNGDICKAPANQGGFDLHLAYEREMGQGAGHPPAGWQPSQNKGNKGKGKSTGNTGNNFGQGKAGGKGGSGQKGDYFQNNNTFVNWFCDEEYWNMGFTDELVYPSDSDMSISSSDDNDIDVKAELDSVPRSLNEPGVSASVKNVDNDLYSKWMALTPSQSVISHEQWLHMYGGKSHHPDGFQFEIVTPNSRLWKKLYYNPKNMRDRWDAISRFLDKCFKKKRRKELPGIRSFVQNKILVFAHGCRLNYCHCLVEIARGANSKPQVEQKLSGRFGFEFKNYIELVEECIPQKEYIKQQFYKTAAIAKSRILKIFPNLAEDIRIPADLRNEYDRIMPDIIAGLGKGCLSQPKLSKFPSQVSPNLNPEEYLKTFLTTEIPFVQLPNIETNVHSALFMSTIKPSRLSLERDKRMKMLETMAEVVEDLYEPLRNLRPKSVERIGSIHNPILMECLNQVLDLPDKSIPFECYWGLRIVGKIDQCGSMLRNHLKETSKHITPLTNGAHQFMRRSKKRLKGKPFQSSSNDTEDYHEGGDDILISKCLVELDRHEAVGPFSEKEMHVFFGKNAWRPMLRFITWSAAKYREIDSGRGSGHNDNTILMDRISCASIETVDNLGVVQREIWEKMGEEFRNPKYCVLGGTEDLKRAYRQVGVRAEDLRWNVAMFPWFSEVRFCIVLGLVFGLGASVVAFNRVSLYLESVARLFLFILCCHYYDDFSYLEFYDVAQQAKSLLYSLFSMLGWLIDPGKSQGPSNIYRWLGAMKILDNLGITTFMSSDRVVKILKMIDNYLLQDWMTPSESATLRGKYGFLALGITGKAGRVGLRALIDRQYYKGKDYTISEALRRNLLWMKLLISVLPPSRTIFSVVKRRVIHLFTDASSEETRRTDISPEYRKMLKEIGAAFGRECKLGWVAFERGVKICAGYADVDQAWLVQWQRSQPIAQAEALAVLIGLMHTLGRSRNVDFICGIDNMVVVNSLIKGNCRENNCDDLINSITIYAASRGCRLWIEYTPSACNPSDEPSRTATYENVPVPQFVIPNSLIANIKLLIFAQFQAFYSECLMNQEENLSSQTDDDAVD